MNKLKITILFAMMLCFAITASAQVKKQPVKKTPVKTTAAKTPPKKMTATTPNKMIPGTRIKITTDSGVMVLRLYDQTPKHRDNFIKLANDHFYDSLLFHRVINGFMIQGGDPQSKNAPPNTMLGGGDVGYTIPAEFDTNFYHKKGALAAARTNNPEKASSGCQFYIAQGKKYTAAELDGMEMQTGLKFSPAKRKVYETIGGIPFLDMNYTVFGEMESGFDVLDKIAAARGDGSNRPFTDIRMKVEVMK
jgi:cyclophilin family peptidyl-prolyl cis-trans isomerase